MSGRMKKRLELPIQLTTAACCVNKTLTQTEIGHAHRSTYRGCHVIRGVVRKKSERRRSIKRGGGT